MTQILHHWKDGSKSNYMGPEVLPNGSDINALITHIVFEYQAEVNGGKLDCFIAYFHGLPKGMVLNSTNKKILCKLFNTQYPEQIKNQWVTLTQELTRDPSGGGKIYGLRFKKTLPVMTPPKKETMGVDHPRFAGAKAAIAAGSTTIEDIKSKFELTNEAEKELCNKNQTTTAPTSPQPTPKEEKPNGTKKESVK